MPFCSDCGTQVSEDTRFCPECGRNVAIGQEGRGTSKRKIAGIIVACVIAVVLIAVLALPPATPVAEPLPPPEQGWIRLRISNVGSIDYPSDFLELQSGDYRELVDEFHIIYEISSSDFALQPVGMNELKLSALEEYRRVLFTTSYLSIGEEVFRANEEYTMSQQEFAAIKDELVSNLSQEFNRLISMGAGNLRIIDPGTLEITEVNGMFPLVWTYKRQLDDNPVVLVRAYQFWDYDRIHGLTFSYRVEDKEDCEDTFQRMLDSFRLERLRQ